MNVYRTGKKDYYTKYKRWAIKVAHIRSYNTIVIHFERKQAGLFQNNFLMRSQTPNSVNLRKLPQYYFKSPKTIRIKQRRKFLNQKKVHDFLRLKNLGKFFCSKTVFVLFFHSYHWVFENNSVQFFKFDRMLCVMTLETFILKH